MGTTNKLLPLIHSSFIETKYSLTLKLNHPLEIGYSHSSKFNLNDLDELGMELTALHFTWLHFP